MHCNIKRFWHIFDAWSKIKSCSINAHKNYHSWQNMYPVHKSKISTITKISFTYNIWVYIEKTNQVENWMKYGINLKKNTQKNKKLLIVLLHSRISVIECCSLQLWLWHIWCREESFRSSISSPPVCGSRTAPTVSLLYQSPWI